MDIAATPASTGNAMLSWLKERKQVRTNRAELAKLAADNRG
jgi:hypothetical protein